MNMNGYDERTNTDGYDEHTNTNGYDERMNTDGYDEHTNTNGYDERTNTDGYDERTNTSSTTNTPTPTPSSKMQMHQQVKQRTCQPRQCEMPSSVGQPQHEMNTKLGAFLCLALVKFFITMASIVHSFES